MQLLAQLLVRRLLKTGSDVPPGTLSFEAVLDADAVAQGGQGCIIGMPRCPLPPYGWKVMSGRAAVDVAMVLPRIDITLAG